ncbi:hypothetical protein [Myxococcus sp. CA056]|uniref:hypothetical protein n=1 Tax=Myxococcus sp. CA056 TaxID=2741740 RepID=UPI0020C653EA|nr:hypothetical protein [Myxococcus sp. CA056]
MNRFTLLSVCAAASLLACTPRASTPPLGEDASTPPPSTETQPPAAPTSPRAEGDGTVASSDSGSRVEDAGTTDAGLLAGSPGDAGTVKCSAMDLPLPEPRTGPPPPPKAVEDMRRRIIAAARACDYAQLSKLADEKGKSVRFTFGDGDDVAAYWKEREAEGEPILARLVNVLDLPYALQGGIYYWPWLHVTGVKNPEDWKALSDVYSEAELKGMRETRDSYYGLRVGISKTGDWQLAVSGD